MLLRSAATDGWRLSATLLGRSSAERLGRRFLTLDQINIIAAKNYHPAKAFPGRITFFQADGIPYLYSISPRAGWGPFAAMGLEVVNVPEDAGISPSEQFARAVGVKLRACLEHV